MSPISLDSARSFMVSRLASWRRRSTVRRTANASSVRPPSACPETRGRHRQTRRSALEPCALSSPVMRQVPRTLLPSTKSRRASLASATGTRILPNGLGCASNQTAPHRLHLYRCSPLRVLPYFCASYGRKSNGSSRSRFQLRLSLEWACWDSLAKAWLFCPDSACQGRVGLFCWIGVQQLRLSYQRYCRPQ